MRIVFDPAIDRGAWPGVLAGARATFAEEWLGPRGLTTRLETELGLGGLVASRGERMVHLARRLEGLDGYWSTSFQADPLATTARLLADRDLLWLWGWRGQAVSPRLGAFAAATAGALPGWPDRVAAIERALARRRTAIDSLVLTAPEGALPTCWRSIFGALCRQGVAVRAALPAPAPAQGDLARARRPGFTPCGDDSVVLLRPHGLLAAAEEVAGALAASDSLEGTVLVGADELLQGALVRHGLPRPAADAAAPASRSALRLVLEAMFEPADPADLFALLCLQPGPVPPGLARQLAGALAQYPGRGSPAWRAALAATTSGSGDAAVGAGAGAGQRERAAALLQPAVTRDAAAPCAEILRRLELLAAWGRDAIAHHPSLGILAAATSQLAELLAIAGVAHLPRGALLRFLDEVEAGGAAASPAEAGLAAVDRPGAILGPARVIVWWGFSRDRLAAAPRLRLEPPEQQALAALGVTPPEASAAAAELARQWRRPLEQATERLVLVCPRTGAAGEPAFAHPLWDELTAAMSDRRLASVLERDSLRVSAAPRRSTAELRPLPAPACAITAAPCAPRDEGESPSSLERLLGCSFAWAMHYRGRLRRNLEPPTPPGPLLAGKLAHHVLARLFAPVPGAAEAETAPAVPLDRGALLDEQLTLLCETLQLPHHQAERAELRRVVLAAAEALTRLLDHSRARVAGTEVELVATAGPVRLAGRADLLLADPDLVIDLKWGSQARHSTSLAEGTALQLAAYAELAAVAGARPGVAYFILGAQQLLAGPDAGLATSLPGVQTPGPHRAVDTWRGALAALEVRLGELARGELHAPGAAGGETRSRLEAGWLHLAPACDHCELERVCGRGAGR